VKLKLTLSPSPGFVAPRSTETDGGEPVGPVAVAPVKDDDTDDSFNPNGEPATSSDNETDVVVGAVTASRPMPSVPRSA